MEEDELDIALGARFDGLGQAIRYAEAMERVAKAEEDIARVGGRNGAGAPTSVGSGPNARLAAAQQALQQARSSGASPATIEDLQYRQRNAQNAVERMRGGGNSAMYNALYSTRFGAGPASPLLGRSMDALLGPQMTKTILGSVAKVAGGPVGIAIGAIMAAGSAINDLAAASAKATNALMSTAVLVGGSVSDAARIQLMGGAIGASGQGARSFQERITSDPNAMGAAASVGVSNAKAPYGRMDFGRQYLSAIERVSAIADANQRQRLAYLLGIEEEVARYSKLSPYTRQALERTAKITERINDPRQAQFAAEYEANATRLGEGWKNIQTILGRGFSEPVLAIQEGLADFMDAINYLADFFEKANSFALMNLVSRAYRAAKRFLPGGGEGDTGKATLTDNIRATTNLTTAIERLTGTIGGGQKTRESLAGLQSGPFLHEMLTKRALRAGAMG